MKPQIIFFLEAALVLKSIIKHLKSESHDSTIAHLFDPTNIPEDDYPIAARQNDRFSIC
jgi:hypothetical protein